MKNCIALALVCCVVGCGGKGGVNVSGKVAYSDGAPLNKGVVVYVGKTGTFRGAIQPNGSYTLEGVLKGDYSVAITGAQEGGEAPSEMTYDEKGNYVPPKPTQATPLIKETYSNPETSGLSKTVPGDYSITVEKP